MIREIKAPMIREIVVLAIVCTIPVCAFKACSSYREIVQHAANDSMDTKHIELIHTKVIEATRRLQKVPGEVSEMVPPEQTEIQPPVIRLLDLVDSSEE